MNIFRSSNEEESVLYNRLEEQLTESAWQKFRKVLVKKSGMIWKSVTAAVFLALLVWLLVEVFGRRSPSLQCFGCKDCEDSWEGCNYWSDVPYEEKCGANPVNIIHCEEGSMCYRMKSEKAGRKFYLRGCVETRKEGCSNREQFNTTGSFCACEKDLCNF